MSEWADERRRNAAAEAEERRRNKAADAEQRRNDQDAAAERHARIRREEDERRRDNAQADKAAARAEKLQARRDKAQRRRERAQAWTKNTTPEVIYRRGTLALVTASALASLPAQIMHFFGISAMLLPLPFALEGAAWVMAAGVAYADERHLPGWVRWMLRAFCLAAAGFAAYINYGYGAEQAPAAGYGLAAVSLLGPLFFEVRQWVGTLSASAVSPKEKAAAKAREAHEKQRARHHKDVVAIASRLVSAAPFGTLPFEDAFGMAWEIKTGTRVPGMTPKLHVQAAQSRVDLAAALAGVDAKASGISPEAAAVELFLAATFTPGDDGDGMGTSGREKAPRGPGGVDTQEPPAGPSKGRFSLGRKGKQALSARGSKTPEKPLAEADLAKVRGLAQTLGGAANLSHSLVKKTVGGGSNEYLVRLRKAVQAEGTAPTE